MVTMAAPLSTPRTDRTADAAIERVAREEPAIYRRLEVPLSEWCGDALVEAFERVARAYYANRPLTPTVTPGLHRYGSEHTQRRSAQ
jgi:hypothetical protein